jgi:hypothetical protein
LQINKTIIDQINQMQSLYNKMREMVVSNMVILSTSLLM